MGERTNCRSRRREHYCVFEYICSDKELFDKDIIMILKGEIVYGICKEKPIY